MKIIYDGNDLREIQWYQPDPLGTAFTCVRFDLQSYYTHTGPGSFGQRDPIERIQNRYLKHLSQPDEILGEKVIEDHHCIGFAIKASRYGDNPGHWLDRIWFDVDTYLPVMIE